MLALYFSNQIKFGADENESIVGRFPYEGSKEFKWRIQIINEKDNWKDRDNSLYTIQLTLQDIDTGRISKVLSSTKIWGLNSLINNIQIIHTRIKNNDIGYEESIYLKGWMRECSNPIKDNRIVDNIHFATLLVKYLENTQEYGTALPHHYEIWDSLMIVAKELRHYQELTATDANEIAYLERTKKKD